MCGIVGYVGQGSAKEFVIAGLKTLEYRGYDSWGLALKEKNDLKIVKKIGRISQAKTADIKSKAKIGIGHTRWATHGGVTVDNAHPHTDCFGNIAVVHNGIIENYQELKNNLIKKGHKFVSETDTEVIPHLVEEYCKNQNLFNAFRLTLKDLKGNYAVCLISKNTNEILAAANGAPLAIGIGENENFVSSDNLAFAGKAEKIIFLKDGSLAQINKEINIVDILSGREKRAVIKKAKEAKRESKLDGYEHFLIKEISEQPAVLGKIANFDTKEIETNAALIRNSFGTFIIACGTAYHAGLVGTYLFAQNANLHINISLASEFPAFGSFLTPRTLMLPISQSGETADVLEAVKFAKGKSVKVISLLNNPDSTLARLSDIVMVTPAGAEIAVLSTKALTAQVGLLYLLSMAISQKIDEAKSILSRISKATQKSLTDKNINKIKTLAKRLKNSKDLFTVGRGLNYPTALEAALKIKEVSYIHAEGFAGGELKHGTIALIEKGVPCIVFVGNDENRDDILSNAEEIKARGGYIIGVAPENNKIFDYFIKVADIPELSPIINIIPMQILAYNLALEKGLDPDKPRNLAKSVTVK